MHASIISNKPDLVVIDQLADIHWHDPKEKKIEWLGKACWHIRQIFAKRMRIPVVVVHQLNRDVEGRPDKRPTLSDLRDSGEIEQRSDIVLGCYREDYYAGRPEGVHIVPFEVSPLKFRQGNSEARAILEYDLATQWFS
jgi:replicative DNA helicase